MSEQELPAVSSNAAKRFGWVPPGSRTKLQDEKSHHAVLEMPVFSMSHQGWSLDGKRHALWQAFESLEITPPYINQVTGSCVGAGGGNMLLTLMAVEIAVQQEPEEFHEVWWPYTYGKSRELGGMDDPGEGSFGSTWAKAAKEFGVFRADHEGLPGFGKRQGWSVLPQEIELEWSDGDAIESRWVDLGREHPVKTVAPIQSADDAAAALANGYPLTLASMFGTKKIRHKGEPAVNLAEWDDQWAHQMFCDEVWDHPDLGIIFRIGNNWGPDAHPTPISGEPAGGFYVTHKTFDKICRTQYSEVFAFSAFAGFPVRRIEWENLIW